MKTKDEVQLEARKAFADNNYWGLIAMATGTGKSKIGVDEVIEAAKLNKAAKVIIAVPTQKLRDKNWPDEFKKWKATRFWTKHVQRYCYVSLNKIKDEVFDLVVLDEGHRITESNSEFFANNTVKRCLILTATPPDKNGNDTDKEKIAILKRLNISTVFHYSLEQAKAEGLVAEFEINVVNFPLDDTNKNIAAGNKNAPFMQTEKAAYHYLDKQTKQMMYSGNERAKMMIIKRMHFVKNSKTKTEVARQMLDEVISKNERYIIFCGSIEQANSLGPKQSYHSGTSDDALFKFSKEKLNRIYVVDSLNEGHNLPNVNGILIVQLNSNKRDLIQRIGRAIRVRPGHVAKIWILVATETVDENWYKKAAEEFDGADITFHHYKNLLSCA